MLRSLARRFAPLLLSAATVAVASASPRSALANSRYPTANQLFFDPSSQGTLYLRTTFGLLSTRDRGEHFQWVCEQSVGFDGEVDPAYAVFAEGNVVACLKGGLRSSRDRACSFVAIDDAELSGHAFIDLTVHAKTPTHGFALASGFEGKTDSEGAPLFYSRVFETTDASITWQPTTPPLDPTLLIETIDVAPSDPMRVYLSAARGVGALAKGVLMVSTDGGHSFEEHAVPFTSASERSLFIAGIDPQDANRVYLRTAADLNQPTRLVVTRDAGATFETAFTAKGALAGFALSEDGVNVWVGGPADGLYQASSSVLAFTKKSDAAIQCLRSREGELWACSNERSSGFVLGVSSDEGTTFSKRLDLAGVAGPLDCAAGTTTHDKCTPLWPKLASELGVDGGGTGSFVDAGPPATPASGSTAAADDGCNCQSDGRSSLSWTCPTAVGLGLAALVLARARRGGRRG